MHAYVFFKGEEIKPTNPLKNNILPRRGFSMVMNARRVVWWRCFLSLVITISYRVVYSYVTFPVFHRTFFWTRLDQGNILSAEPWGTVIASMIAALAVRTFDTKKLVILSHLWQAYFAIYFSFLTTSFYEFWANRFFGSMFDSLIFISVFHTLLQWLPADEILPSSFFLLSSIGVGYLVGTAVAWTCYAKISWSSMYICMGLLSLITAYLWKSKKITSHPSANTVISKQEASIIHSSHIKINRKDLSRYWSDMLMNFETLRFGISAFSMGYALLGLLYFHGILCIEAVSLQSELYNLPFRSAMLPWTGWLAGSFVIGIFIQFNIRIPIIKKMQFFYGTKDILLVEGILLLLIFGILHGVPHHPDLFWMNIRFFALYFYLSIALTCFIVSHIHCENSEPELLLGWSLTWFSLGGVISMVLGGLILEMAGSWTFLFRYQANLLLFSSLVCKILPWLYRYGRQTRKRTITAQQIDTAL